MNPPSGPRIFVHGTGAVSPAGWDAAALSAALAAGTPYPVTTVDGGAGRQFDLRKVPVPTVRPTALQHPRLRRSSVISHFAVSAALEAMGGSSLPDGVAPERLGIICAVMGGGVIYSRRFFSEVLANPATASPLLFPETVFNAPAAHLGAVLGATGPNYTCVGDQTGFVAGMGLAADWLSSHLVDACLVVGAEEADWLTARALSLFTPGLPAAEGGGALLLRRESSPVELDFITAPVPYLGTRSRTATARQVRDQLPAGDARDLLVDSLGAVRSDAAEKAAWKEWPGTRVSPRRILGEGFGAGGAWACVAAVQSVVAGAHPRAWVQISGSNLQSVATGFASAHGS